MKNVQVIDGADNCVYRIYQFTEEQFALIFPGEQDIEFIDDARDRLTEDQLEAAFKDVWDRRVKKPDAQGIHGTLFYELEFKKKYYPTKSERDVEGFV